jgi:hypothetical protein
MNTLTTIAELILITMVMILPFYFFAFISG